MRFYNKEYDNLEQAYNHYQTYLINKNQVQKLNQLQSKAQYEINEFGDISQKEFLQGSGLDLLQKQQKIVRNIHNHNITNDKIKIVNLPETFDWREKNAVTPVRNQGICESCWAISAVQNIESQYFLKYNELIQFSAQQLVDCDYHDDRCWGGLYDNAFHFLMEDQNLEREIDYPYLISHNLNCLYKKPLGVLKVTNFTKIPKDEELIKQSLVQHGPLSVAINSKSLQFYKDGIIEANTCEGIPDHAVLLVGYAKQNETNYWIVKNSFGEKWGIDGYFHVEMGQDACGINNDVTQVEIEMIKQNFLIL